MRPATPDEHYSEADLLETYYMQPGASMPVMMHLADCADCAARYERLEQKVRGLAACAHDEKPDTFWARQRIVGDAQARPRDSVGRTRRRAWPRRRCSWPTSADGWHRGARRPATVRRCQPEIAVQVTTPADPWESEELDEYPVARGVGVVEEEINLMKRFLVFALR